MEEADQILLSTLRSAGLQLPDEILSCEEFDPELLVSACGMCLSIINPDAKQITKLPGDPSSRFRVCNELATQIQNLGWNTDLNFQQFLYPSARDTRKLLAFLLDHLPKTTTAVRDSAEEAKETDSLIGRVETVLSRCAATFNRRKKQGLAPAAAIQAKAAAAHVQGVPFWTRPLSVGDPKFLTSQPTNPALLAASLLEYTAQGAIRQQAAEDKQFRLLESSGASRAASSVAEFKEGVRAVLGAATAGPARDPDDQSNPLALGNAIHGGLFAHTAAFSKEAELAAAGWKPKAGTRATRPGGEGAGEGAAEATGRGEDAHQSVERAHVETPEERLERLEAENAELRGQLARTLEQIGSAEARGVAAGEQKGALQRRIADVEAATPALEADYVNYKQAAQLVLQAESSTEDEVAQQIAAQQERLQTLRQEWEEKRAPLEERLAAGSRHSQEKRATAEKKLASMKQMRAEMRAMVGGAREREEQYKGLVAEYEAASKSLQRSTFVQRIMEIIKNIKHQEADIRTIIDDTRVIQREINSASEQLKRAHVVVDDLLYREAKASPSFKPAYITFHSIHTNFAKLINNVEETGRAQREVRELTGKLNEMAQRPLDIDQIAKDIEAVRAENKALQQQAKRTRSASVAA